MEFNWIEFNQNNIPTCSGVYGIKHKGVWAYIGMSKNIQKRLTSRSHAPFRISLELSDIEYFYIPKTEKIKKFESFIIKSLEPEWNGYVFDSTCRDTKNKARKYSEGLYFMFHSRGWNCHITRAIWEIWSEPKTIDYSIFNPETGQQYIEWGNTLIPLENYYMYLANLNQVSEQERKNAIEVI